MSGGNSLQLKAIDLYYYYSKDQYFDKNERFSTEDDKQYKIDYLYNTSVFLYNNNENNKPKEYYYNSKGEFHIYLATFSETGLSPNTFRQLKHSGLTASDNEITYNLGDYVIIATPKIKYDSYFKNIEQTLNGYYIYKETHSSPNNIEIPFYMFHPLDFRFECFNLMALRCNDYELEENLDDIEYLLNQKTIFKDHCTSYNALLERIKNIKENNGTKYKTANCKCPYSDTIKVNYSKMLPPSQDYYYPYC